MNNLNDEANIENSYTSFIESFSKTLQNTKEYPIPCGWENDGEKCGDKFCKKHCVYCTKLISDDPRDNCPHQNFNLNFSKKIDAHDFIYINNFDLRNSKVIYFEGLLNFTYSTLNTHANKEKIPCCCLLEIKKLRYMDDYIKTLYKQLASSSLIITKKNKSLYTIFSNPALNVDIDNSNPDASAMKIILDKLGSKIRFEGIEYTYNTDKKNCIEDRGIDKFMEEQNAKNLFPAHIEGVLIPSKVSIKLPNSNNENNIVLKLYYKCDATVKKNVNEDILNTNNILHKLNSPCISSIHNQITYDPIEEIDE
jgi:hypothetical protein